MTMTTKEQVLAKLGPVLAKRFELKGFFVQDTDIPILIGVDRFIRVLVRCGNGRFFCPVQDVKHFVDIIESHYANSTPNQQMGKGGVQPDYVRDVSLYFGD